MLFIFCCKESPHCKDDIQDSEAMQGICAPDDADIKSCMQRHHGHMILLSA